MSKSRMGRPLIGDAPKGKVLQVRLSEDEIAAIAEAAARAGAKPSAWARRVLLDAALKSL